eukprot:15341075-Ditylum_brightwellii.AAC.1
MSKLESDPSWTKIKDKSNVAELLTTIKGIAYKYKSQSYPYKAVHNALQSFYFLYQKDDTSLEKYTDTFLNMTDVARHSNGKIDEHPKLHRYILKMNGDEGTTNTTTIERATKASAEAYPSYTFIAGANHKKCVKLLEDLSNAYHRGKDEYSKTLVGAHQVLASWENKSAIIYG